MTPRASLFFALALALALGCDETVSPPAAPSAAASLGVPASAAPSSSAASSIAKAPWYAGSFAGSYEARVYLLEMSKKEGAVRQWTEDADGAATGDGEISLTIDEKGVATGSAKGPLGAQTIRGELLDEELRLSIKSEASEESDAKLWSGFVIAKRTAGQDEFKGLLQASSGDSLKVRDAPVTLTRSNAGRAGTRTPTPSAQPSTSASPSASAPAR